MSNMVHDAGQSADLLKQILDRIPYRNHMKVHTCNNLTVPRHWEFNKRINEDFHIIFIKGGEGVYTIGEGKSVPLEKGKIIFVSAGMLHSAVQNTENPPNIIPVRFGVYENDTRLPMEDWSQPFCLDLIPSDILEFQQLFERLHASYVNGKTYGVPLGGAILSEILYKLYDEFTEGLQEPKGDVRIEKVKQWIDQNPQMRYEPDQLAQLAELSEKYFRTMFKRQYGLTPTEYQTKARMEYARFLLVESRQSIKEIALSVGYPDLYTFSKQFKQVMGYPPSQLKLSRKSGLSSTLSPKLTRR